MASVEEAATDNQDLIGIGSVYNNSNRDATDTTTKQKRNNKEQQDYLSSKLCSCEIMGDKKSTCRLNSSIHFNGQSKARFEMLGATPPVDVQWSKPFKPTSSASIEVLLLQCAHTNMYANRFLSAHVSRHVHTNIEMYICILEPMHVHKNSLTYPFAIITRNGHPIYAALANLMMHLFLKQEKHTVWETQPQVITYVVQTR